MKAGRHNIHEYKARNQINDESTRKEEMKTLTGSKLWQKLLHRLEKLPKDYILCQTFLCSDKENYTENVFNDIHVLDF